MHPHQRLAAFVSSLLAAFLPTIAVAQDMTPKQIQESWIGKAVSGETGQGKKFTMRLNADGSLAISGEAANDTGTWRLSDNGYCTTWSRIRAGQERCFTVRAGAAGTATVFNPDGSVSGNVSKVE